MNIELFITFLSVLDKVNDCELTRIILSNGYICSSPTHTHSLSLVPLTTNRLIYSRSLVCLILFFFFCWIGRPTHLNVTAKHIVPINFNCWFYWISLNSAGTSIIKKTVHNILARPTNWILFWGWLTISM